MPTTQTLNQGTTTGNQTGWVQYAENRRYNPATGQAQIDPSGNGNWQDIGTIPLSAGTGSYWQNVRLTSPGLVGQLPSQDILRQIAISQQMAAAGGGQSPSPAAAQGGGWGTPSYLGAPQINMGGAWQPTGVGGAQGGAQAGVTGAQSAGGTSMATNVASQISPYSSLPAWQTWYGQNVGKQMMVNGQAVTIGQDITADQLLQAFRTNPNGLGWNVPASGAQAPQQQIGGAGQPQPESVALQQMAQIDPTSEALRQSLGQSYLTNLAARPSAPAAGDVQSYLDLYKQIDPQGYAQRVALAGGMDQFVQNAQAQAALGSQLDPGTIREVEQGTRAAQIARGNVYGTPQLVAETMARGSAGEQRMLQRQQMLQSALGQQQSYLGSGLGLGDVANTLYNQGYNRFLQGQGAALGYLGSGQTPYQAGASYLNMAQQQAAAAAQGGPQYNPASLGQQYTGAGAPSFPQYGLDVSQLAGNWYNNINQANLQAYGLGQAYGGSSGGQRAMGAGIGALGGAASGALAGAAAGGVGAIPGAIIGGIAGGASGYFK